MKHTLFTLGYQKREVAELIGILQQNGIKAVADLRAAPYSRKKGFSKKALAAELEKNDIEYYHFGELGSPKELRDKVRADNDYAYFFKAFGKFLNDKRDPLKSLCDLAISKPTCLICFERDINECHRKVVAERLDKIHRGEFKITHLNPE
jgi:uncharacterized protein (DUF488 family)